MCIFKSKATKRQEAALKRARDRKANKPTQNPKPAYEWSENNCDVNHRG